jgi:hypothetical protein
MGTWNTRYVDRYLIVLLTMFSSPWTSQPPGPSVFSLLVESKSRFLETTHLSILYKVHLIEVLYFSVLEKMEKGRGRGRGTRGVSTPGKRRKWLQSLSPLLFSVLKRWL